MAAVESEPRKTGFYESCLAEGASFVEFRGWWLAAEFSGVEEEYWAYWLMPTIEFEAKPSQS